MINKNEMYIKVENGNDGFVHIRAFCNESNNQIFDKTLKNLLTSEEHDIEEHEEHEDDGLYHHYGEMSISGVKEMYRDQGFEVKQ